MHPVSKILFCHETLHFSGIFCAHHQELSVVHVATGMFHAGYLAAVVGALGAGRRVTRRTAPNAHTTN
jgi:type II secretory pathway predicted ATPase ExeA